MITPDLKPLADAAIANLKGQGSKLPVVQLMPTFKGLFPDDESDDFEYLPDLKNSGPDDPICILHSSGMPRRFCLSSASVTMIAVTRFGYVPEGGHLYESYLGLLLALSLVRRP